MSELSPTNYKLDYVDKSEVILKEETSKTIIIQDGMPGQLYTEMCDTLSAQGITVITHDNLTIANAVTFENKREQAEKVNKVFINECVFNIKKLMLELDNVPFDIDKKKAFVEPKQTYINHKDKFQSKRKFKEKYMLKEKYER